MRISFGEFWGLAIIASLFYWRTGINLNLVDAKAMFLALASIMSLIFYGLPKIREPAKIAMATIVGVCFFKMYNGSSLNAIHQWMMISMGALVFLQVLAVASKGDLKILKAYLGVACIALSISVILSPWDLAAPYPVTKAMTKHGVIPIEQILGKVLPGALGNQGFSAMFIVTTAPFLLSAPWALILPAAALGGIAAYGTETPLLTFLAILALYFWGRFKWAPLIVISGIASSTAGLSLLPRSTIESLASSGERFKLWKLIAGSVSDMPWFGHGPGIFRDAMKSPYAVMKGPSGRPWDFVCNEYLEGAYLMGAVGMGAIFFIALEAFKGRRGMDCWAFSALAVAILSLTWFPFHIASVSFVAIIVFSVLAKNGGSLCEMSLP